jgi:NNP family nitrate/nitrite transporter-like MFS transporter
MFTKETAGTVNGIVAGWGNSGGAFAQVLIGSALFPLFTNIYDGDRERSWRTICIIPAIVAFVCGCCIHFISDDAPMGNYKEMKKNSTMDLSFYATKWTHSGWTDRNAWLLGLQYACCFGVELVMNNGASLYFSYKFGMGTEAAAATASAFGWMNLFARFAGGKLSDKLNLSHGMRGRLWLQSICLLLEGGIIVAFAFADSLASSIITMCIFSIFVQAAEGAIYGVVPYVSKAGIVGSAAGIVGSGGNIGGMAFGFVFRSLSFKTAFIVMGSIVMSSSFLSLFIHIHGHSGLVTGEDSVVTVAARERYLNQRRRGN